MAEARSVFSRCSVWMVRWSVPDLWGKVPEWSVYDVGLGDDSAIGGNVYVADDVGGGAGNLIFDDEA